MSKPEPFGVTRRDFLKSAGVSGLATAALAGGEVPRKRWGAPLPCPAR